jgi:ABC-2 type transport system permease protein
MNAIWAIMHKEVRSYFNSFIPYALAAFYVLINAIFFTGLVATSRQATMRDMFGTMAIILLFVLPFLTMRLLAEEEASGTFELLLTAPVREWEVVVGKYLAALVVLATMLAVTLFFPFFLFRFGNPDPWPIASGYLGLLLIGAVVLAVGIFASSLTKQQLVAGAIAFFLLIGLWIIDFIASPFPALAQITSKITLNGRAQDLWQGVIDTKDLLFFASVILVMLFVTTQIVQSRRWR